jgi:hypothetical protein
VKEIKQLKAQPVEVLTWTGDEDEAREFGGEYFLAVDHDRAVFTTMAGTLVGMKRGMRAFRPADHSAPPLYLNLPRDDSDWNTEFDYLFEE